MCTPGLYSLLCDIAATSESLHTLSVALLQVMNNWDHSIHLTLEEADQYLQHPQQTFPLSYGIKGHGVETLEAEV